MAETSPLRRRMIEDMTVRNLSPATQRSYVHAVSKFSRFFGRSPETLALEAVRTYQVHLASKGVAWASLNQTVAAFPAALSRTPRHRLRRRRAALLRRPRSACRAPRLRRPLRGAAPDRLGGLRQAALRRPRAGAGLSRPLHPPRRHRQQPARRHDRRRRQLPLEGLSAGRPPQGHDARAGEFMRRFLLHVLPSGFHRIRHFGFLANGHRAARLALCRRLLAQPVADRQGERDAEPDDHRCAPPCRVQPEPDVCPCCGSLSLILSTLPRAPPHPAPARR